MVLQPGVVLTSQTSSCSEFLNPTTRCWMQNVGTTMVASQICRASCFQTYFAICNNQSMYLACHKLDSWLHFCSTQKAILFLSSLTSWVCNGQNSQLQFVAFFRHPAMLKSVSHPWTRGKIRKYLRNLVEFLNLKFRFWLGDPPYYCKLIWGELRWFFAWQTVNSMLSSPMAPTTSGHALWRGHDGGALFLIFHVIDSNGITWFHQPEALTFVTSPVAFFWFSSLSKLETKISKPRKQFFIS